MITPERQSLLDSKSSSRSTGERPSWVEEDGIRDTNPSPASPKPILPSADTPDDLCCCCLDPVLCWFRFFHFLGGAACILAFVSNTVYGQNDLASLYAIIMRLYVAVFSIVLLLIQLQMPLVTHSLALFDMWVYRGFFFAYIGLRTINADKEYFLFENVVGIFMLVMGFIYFLLGMCCMKVVEDRRLIRFHRRK